MRIRVRNSITNVDESNEEPASVIRSFRSRSWAEWLVNEQEDEEGELRSVALIWLLSLWACGAEGGAPEPDWVVSTFQRRFWYGYCSMTRPAVSEGVMYLGGGYAWDNKTYVSAVDLSSRRMMWRFESREIFTGSSILVGGHAIYLAAGEKLHALSRADGVLLWSYQGVGYHRVEQEGIVYTTRRGPALVALEGMTGVELWRRPTHRWLDAPPVVLGDYVYFSDAGVLQSVHRMTGQSATPLPQFVKAARLTVVQQKLYFTAQSSPSDDRRVTVTWQPTTGQLEILDKEFLSVQDNLVYFVTEPGIQAIDVDSGAELWAHDNLSTAALGGAVFRGKLMFQRDLGGNMGRLNAFDLDSGNQLWSFRAGDRVEDPVVTQDMLLLSSDDCKMYAFDLR